MSDEHVEARALQWPSSLSVNDAGLVCHASRLSYNMLEHHES